MQGECDQDISSLIILFALPAKHLSMHLLMDHKTFCLLAFCPAPATSFNNALGSQQSLVAASLSVCSSPLVMRAILRKLPAQLAAAGGLWWHAELWRSVTLSCSPAYLTVYGPAMPETRRDSSPLPRFVLLWEPGGFVSSCPMPLKRRWEFLCAIHRSARAQLRRKKGWWWG